MHLKADMEKINKLGFGFLRLPMNGAEPEWETVNTLVDAYMEAGGSYFDTCWTYLKGQSEAAIRRCVTERKERESIRIADKIPGYQCRSYEDCKKYFDAELERCGVEYFDVCLLHWLNGANYEIAEKLDEFAFLSEMKKEGKAKKIGFSYHDNAALLEEILCKHPEVDLVQLQINYLDWESAGIESRKCYETCVKHGKKIIVMEPVRGGMLASLPEEAEKILKAVHSDWTPADWALRFVQSLPQVELCLSGMNTMEQVIANTKPFVPLTEAETETLFSIVPVILKQTAIPCTGCRYCQPHCKKNIPIPDYFKLYNEVKRFPGDAWKLEPAYAQMNRTFGKASDCIACGACAKKCPQKLDIPGFMKKVRREFE